MSQLGLLIPGEIYNNDLTEMIDLSVAAEDAGFDSLWKGETSAPNGFMALTAIADRTSDVTLGTGVANVYSRSPALLGMSAATLDRVSGGRAALGLGVSSPPIVENWHGAEFSRPLRRMRESIEIVRQITDGGTLEYDGEIFDVGPYSVGLSAENPVPIYNAAMGETNRQLTGEFADGWMPILVPFSEMESQVADVERAAEEAGRDRPVMAPWIVVSPASDPDYAKRQAKHMLAHEMAMGYNRLMQGTGFGDAADEAGHTWRTEDRDAAADVIPDEMVEEFAVYGTADDCVEGLEAYLELGVDHPVVWLPFSLSYSELEEAIEGLGAGFGD